MEPIETMYSPAYLPGRQYSHGSSSIYESPLDLSINTVQQASAAMIPDPENISLPHGGRFLGQSGSSSSVFSQTHMLYPNANASNNTSFQQQINFDVHSTRGMPVLFPYGHPPSSFTVSQSHGIAFNQNSYAQQMSSSPATTNHRVDIQVNGQHMSGWTAKKDHGAEIQVSRNAQKNLKVYQNGPLMVSYPSNSHGLSDQAANILNTSQVYNTSRLSPLILPSAVAPSALHVRKKEGADGNQKDSPRTARDFPDQPGQTVSFPRASCTTTNIEESVITINSSSMGSIKLVNSGQPGNSFCVAKSTSNHLDDSAPKSVLSSSQEIPSFKTKEPLNLGESSSYVPNISENSDSNFSTTMPRLKAVSPGGHRNSTENSTSPLSPPPLIAAVDSSLTTSTVQEQNSDVPKLLPQIFQWHEPSGKPNCSDSSTVLTEGKCSNTPLSRNTCDAILSETISAILENKPCMFQQSDSLSVVLQLPNFTRSAASPNNMEDCRKTPVSLPQSNFFCTDQKFTSPLPMDSVINKHHSSRGDMPLFSTQTDSVWNIPSNTDNLNDSKSFVMESGGMSAVHVDCHSYIHQIKTEKQSPVEKETAGASDFEDSKPDLLGAAGSSVFHNHHVDSFRNATLGNRQNKKKPDPIAIGTTAVSDFFQSLESKYCPFLPQSGNVQSSFATHNCGRAKPEFGDQTHLVSSLTSKNGNRGSNIITYAEIHPVPKEFLGSCRGIGSDCVVSTHQQIIPCTPLHIGNHSAEHHIKKESTEIESEEVLHVQSVDSNVLSLPLSNGKHSIPSVSRESIALPICSKTTPSKSIAFSMDKQLCARKLTASSVVQKPSTRYQTSGYSETRESPSFTVKQEPSPCERLRENQGSPVDDNKSTPENVALSRLKRKPDQRTCLLSHSQAKRRASSKGYTKDKNTSYTVNKIDHEQSLSQCEDLQIQDITEKTIDVSLDIERSRRTTFIDFKPEVFESRTRHQKSNFVHKKEISRRFEKKAIDLQKRNASPLRPAVLHALFHAHDHIQGRRGRRRFVGNRKSRERPERYPIHSPSKNIKKTKFLRSHRKTFQNDLTLDSNSVGNSLLCSLPIFTDQGEKNFSSKCKEKLTTELYRKDGSFPSEVCDSFRSTPNHNLSGDPTVYSNEHLNVKSKPHAIRHQRRRRLKSGLDMIRKKKSSAKKKIIHPPVRKEQKEKKKPQVTDLRKIVVNKSLGESPLHRAARQGNLVKKMKLDLVQLCITSCFCSVNCTDNAGYTPLHEACSKGHLEVARALLQYNAEVNACATGGVRPIHDAVENDYVEIVRLLLSYGADPTISTYSGRTLGSFVKSRVMAKFLRGYFADVGIVPDPSLFSSSCTYTKSWSFAGSASCLDPETSGYDVCSIQLLDAKSLSDEDPGFIFESSEQEMIPTFSFSLSSGSESQTYVLLNDVLQQLHMTETEFTVQYPNVETVTVPVHDFKARAACCQITANPVIPQNSYNVQIILYTEQIRSILGIKSMYIVL